MSPVVKEQYEKVNISKDAADKIYKKAYNKRRDKLISIGIVALLIIIFFVVIFNSLRNHAANSVYERIYGYTAFDIYSPKGGSETIIIDGDEFEFDTMHNTFSFKEGNIVEWTRKFDIDLGYEVEYSKDYVSTHEFEIRSDAFEGDPYVYLLDSGIILEIVFEDVLGQPISEINYLGAE